MENLINHAIEKIIQLCENEEYSTALKICQQAIKVNPFKAEVWYLSGICNLKLGEKENSLDCFAQAEINTNIEENKQLARKQISLIKNESI